MTEEELEQMHSWIVWDGKATCTECGQIKTGNNKFRSCPKKRPPEKLSIGQILARLHHYTRMKYCS